MLAFAGVALGILDSFLPDPTLKKLEAIEDGIKNLEDIMKTQF